MEDKRKFTRIVFTTPASLEVDGRLIPVKLIDLSLKGALLEISSNTGITTGLRCNLAFTLGNVEPSIEFDGEIAHVEPTTIGITCTKMELESASHLKRLIELNVGSEELLHRNLESLSHP